MVFRAEAKAEGVSCRIVDVADDFFGEDRDVGVPEEENAVGVTVEKFLGNMGISIHPQTSKVRKIINMHIYFIRVGYSKRSAISKKKVHHQEGHVDITAEITRNPMVISKFIIDMI